MISGHVERFLLLSVLSVTYCLLVDRVERLRLAVSERKVPHLLGVWTFAGAMLLPGPMTAALVVITYVVSWPTFRRAGQQPARYLYTVLTIAASCMAASAVMGGIPGAAGIAAGVATFSALNMSLIAAAIVWSRQLPVLRMFRSVRMQATELAILGGGIAVASTNTWHSGLEVLALPILIGGQYLATRDSVHASQAFNTDTRLWGQSGWTAQADDLAGKGNCVTLIVVKPEDLGRERLIGVAFSDCLDADDDVCGSLDGGRVVAIFSSVMPDIGMLVADRVRIRLADLAVDCRTACVSSSLMTIDELLAQAEMQLVSTRVGAPSRPSSHPQQRQ